MDVFHVSVLRSVGVNGWISFDDVDFCLEILIYWMTSTVIIMTAIVYVRQHKMIYIVYDRSADTTFKKCGFMYILVILKEY